MCETFTINKKMKNLYEYTKAKITYKNCTNPLKKLLKRHEIFKNTRTRLYLTKEQMKNLSRGLNKKKIKKKFCKKFLRKANSYIFHFQFFCIFVIL